MSYMKHFIPLESDPGIFTELMHNLGVSESLEFVDVYSLDDPQELARVPRPVRALILILPTSETYEQHKTVEEHDISISETEAKDIMWFRQLVNNACGLYAILHTVCNLRGDFIKHNSILDRLITACRPHSADERARYIEAAEDIELVYNKAARQGSSEVPPAEDEVDFHYICYVSSSEGRLYELDGDRKGPMDRGPFLASSEDILTAGVLDSIKEHVRRENGLQFALMALAPRLKDWARFGPAPQT